MSYTDEVRKGEDADRVLADPVLNEALKAIKDELYAKWATTAPADKEGREHYWRLHEAALMFERVLVGYVQSGNAALSQMKHKQRFSLFK